MKRAEEHLAALLALPAEERAQAARVLLESLDDAAAEAGAAEAQVAEVARRVRGLDEGKAQLISGPEARARIMARLRQLRFP